MRTDVAIKAFVIQAYQFITHGDRLVIQPFVELAAYLLYLRGCRLYGFFIGYTDTFTVAHYLFGDFRNRIVQGVDEQGFPTIASNRIDIIGNGRMALQRDNIGVIHIKIHHCCVYPEQVFGKGSVNTCRNPTLTHIEVKFFIRNKFGGSIFQSLDRCSRPFLSVACQVGKNGTYLLALLHDITCKEFAFVLPTIRQRIVEYLTGKGFCQFCFGLSGCLYKIVHIDRTVIVKAACQCFYRCQLNGSIYFLERNRLVHDVGFTDILSELHFNREYFHAQTIPREKLLVVVVVEKAPLAHISIIVFVELFP